ncbi:hypothetical protein C8R45DRAFT_923967 [Mycena sanguinolenta]|nr:hypothetical protein C8R45DRAFT_923967 [Mycena sanguinolenta]
MLQQGAIFKVTDELLDKIFVQCLPSREPVLASYFDSTRFVTPSRTTAPLLLCRVCGYWRDLAIRNPHLWSSLSTELIRSSELVELWLRRANGKNLSLRIDRLVSRLPEHTPIHPPRVLHEHYASPVPLHLSLLVPKLHQCQRLELLNWGAPPDHVVMPESAPVLESLSLTLHSRNTSFNLPSPHSLSKLLAHAPHLSRLHWNAPLISIPWSQLQYLSWRPQNMGVFRATIPELTGVTCLRLEFPWGFFEHGMPLPEPFICPQVTEFFLHGNVAGLGTVVLPQLRHLVLEVVYSQSEAEEDTVLMLLLERSRCTIEIFEIHGGASDFFPARRLLHPSIAPTLTRLLISSHDLDAFFLALETAVPDTLPQDMRLLRSVDRCFQIDGMDFTLPGVAPNILAVLLGRHFPRLTQLDLDDHFPDEGPIMSRTVTAGDVSFLVRRNAALWREYKAWWNSYDGEIFRAILASRDLLALSHFEIRWDKFYDGPVDGRNAFARLF